MNYADRLEAAVQAKSNPCLVGLDPHLQNIPGEFPAASDASASRAERAAAAGDFLCEVIDVVSALVPAVKPQSAFFEALGSAGVVQWERVVRRAREAGLIVIGDVKRGDIGSTARAYADAFLGPEADACDAITINPYLGSDSVEPFLDACRAHDKGLYVLVRTSNPSSSEFQTAGDPPLAERVAAAVDRWGAELVGASGLSAVGAVVGATHASELADWRAKLPRTPFLLPGYGAQGAGAKDVIGGFLSGGRGALVNSSRGILYAYEKDDDPSAWESSIVRETTRLASALWREE